MRRRQFLILLAILTCGIMALSQSTTPPARQPALTLRVYSRVVLLDVSVTDAKGTPVHGLTRPDFEVFDNTHQQRIASLEEHVDTPMTPYRPATTTVGTYSNEALIHPPQVINIILIDSNTIDMPEQMYLYDQLNRFVGQLPANQPVAIYYRWGDYTMLLQDFTSDRDLLLKAVRKAIPRLPIPGSSSYSDVDTLKQILAYVDLIPGRKNVLWISSGSNIFLAPTPNEDAFPSIHEEEALREIYDKLEAARVSLYPIDARGLVYTGSSPELNSRLFGQHGRMSGMALATGGREYYNNNGLSQVLSQVITDDASYYTLTYSPNDLHLDKKWHKLKVRAKGHAYELSYRQGYFDDGMNDAATPPKRASRTLLQAGGKTETVPDNRNEPIIFQAQVLPATELGPAMVGKKPNPTKRHPKPGETTYTVHYTVPLNAFLKTSNGSSGTLKVGVAVMTFNQYGGLIGRLSQTLHLSFNEAQSNNAKAQIAFDQSVNLPKGNDTLYLAVWDAASGRVGAIEIPVANGDRR